MTQETTYGGMPSLPSAKMDDQRFKETVSAAIRELFRRTDIAMERNVQIKGRN